MKNLFLVAGMFILFLILSMSCGEDSNYNRERNMDNTVPAPYPPSTPQADSPRDPPQVNDTPGSDTSTGVNHPY